MFRAKVLYEMQMKTILVSVRRYSETESRLSSLQRALNRDIFFLRCTVLRVEGGFAREGLGACFLQEKSGGSQMPFLVF